MNMNKLRLKKYACISGTNTGMLFPRLVAVFFFMAIASISTEIRASKAVATPFEVTLADGRKTTVILRGDEHFHYHITKHGELVVREKNVWRIMTEKERQSMRREYEKMRVRRAESLPVVKNPFPHTGTPKALVIMVSYQNLDFTYGKSDIDAWLNSTEYTPWEQKQYSSYGSVAQFFSDNSNGKFRPVFDVVGPYKMSKTMEYYGANTGGNDTPSLYHELINEACAAADKDGVDFSQYDADNDGLVDLIYVYYAGYGENMGGVPSATIWPKSGYYTGFNSFDGKKVYRYGMSNELLGYPGLDTAQGWPKPKLNGIGVFVHEMCHTLGLPDVYPTVDWDDVTMYDNQSMEEWDIMDGGENIQNGFYPAPFTAWEREWMGWTDEIETITAPGTYTLKPLKDGGKAYRIKNPNDATGKEFYILENVPSNVQGWYRGMPGSGMLITHINYDESKFSNFGNPNNIAGSPRWTIVPANGVLYSAYRRGEPENSKYYLTPAQINENRRGNTFPGLQGVTTLTYWKEYTPAMEYTLSNISQSADGTVKFDFSDDTLVPVTAITLDKSSAEMNAGDTLTITATVQPANATDKDVTWATSDETVATVADGVVTALKAGKATITASADMVSASCEVTVLSATGIENIGTDNLKSKPMYNLNGQRVNIMRKGVYIINGKKISR